jgi:hypothetical protein
LALLALLGCALPATRAAALGGEGTPITSSDYSLDLTQGAVLSTSRVTGMAGAATALAEGVEGGLSNPAAVVARSPGSADFWDYWLTLGLTYPFAGGDYYNSGGYVASESNADSFLFWTSGAYLQLYKVGVGVNLEFQQTNFRSNAEGQPEVNVRSQLATSHVQVGYLLFDGQLAVAFGLQLLRQSAITKQTATVPEHSKVETGPGFELGALLRPNGAQWRIGAGLYSQVRTRYGEGELAAVAPEFIEPRYAVRPWRGNIGFAYQFGKRPLNPRWTYVEEHARQPLRELEQRAHEACLAHARTLLQLRRTGNHGLELAEQRRFEDQLLLLDAERAAVRKRAWRELRSTLRKGWPRRYLLVATELSFVGRVENAVGVESFLAQRVQRSGEHASVTPRLALESEVWPGWVKARVGSYIEASRFAESSARPHGTLGVDVRVVHWDVFGIWPEDYLWQLSGALDASRDYKAFSVGIGGWY